MSYTKSNHWFTPSHEVVHDQGIAMVSEVATCSRGSEKTVNLVSRGKLNSCLSRQR